VTEEQKKAANEFADKLGETEGRKRIVDRWEERAEETHKSSLATNDAWRRQNEDTIVSRANETARADRYETQHEREWARNAERHEVWLADVRHAQAHREREVAALERIAEVLGRKAH
jgi:hypothetical protein